MVTLNDLQADQPRAITDGPFGSNLASAHYRTEGPRVVRLQNIGDGHFIDSAAYISEEYFQKLRQHEVLAGDLLLASLGETLPRACLAPSWLGPAIVKADCIRVRLADRVDPRWALYAMQRPEVRNWAEKHRHGVGRPRLGLKVIRAIPVPLPPLPEQQRILAVLEDHLSRLDAARSYAQGAFDKARAWRLSITREIMPGSDVSQRSIADLLVRSLGGVWGAALGEDEVDVDVIRVTELGPGGRIDPSTAAARAVSKSQLANRQLQEGDLLLEKSGGGPRQPVGRVGIVKDLQRTSVCSNFMQLMRPDQTLVRPDYLHLYLNDLHERGGTAHLQKATTNIRNIKASEYLGLPVPVPALEEQDRIVASISQQAEAADNLSVAIKGETFEIGHFGRPCWPRRSRDA